MKYLLVFLIFMAPDIVWAGGYHKTVNNYYVDYDVNNFTITDKDASRAAAIAGAAAAHHFTKSVHTNQGSFAGACYDSSSDECAFSIAGAKVHGNILYSIGYSRASNDALINFSAGWTW